MTEALKDWIISSLEEELDDAQIYFTFNEVGKENRKLIPPAWIKLLSAPVDESEYATLKSLWSPIFDKIPLITRQLSRVLKSIAVMINDSGEPSLLYIYADQENNICCHRGNLPLNERDIPENIKELWEALPQDFRNFYKIHNGWTVLDLGDMGLLSVQDMSFLSSEEWGLEHKVIENTPVDVEKTLIVFSSGGSGYLGFEIDDSKNPEDTKPLIWWTNKTNEPKFDIHFWNTFDAWVNIHFEEMAYSFDPIGDEGD